MAAQMAINIYIISLVLRGGKQSVCNCCLSVEAVFCKIDLHFVAVALASFMLTQLVAGKRLLTAWRGAAQR